MAVRTPLRLATTPPTRPAHGRERDALASVVSTSTRARGRMRQSAMSINNDGQAGRRKFSVKDALLAQMEVGIDANRHLTREQHTARVYFAAGEPVDIDRDDQGGLTSAQARFHLRASAADAVVDAVHVGAKSDIIQGLLTHEYVCRLRTPRKVKDKQGRHVCEEKSMHVLDVLTHTMLSGVGQVRAVAVQRGGRVYVSLGRAARGGGGGGGKSGMRARGLWSLGAVWCTRVPWRVHASCGCELRACSLHVGVTRGRLVVARVVWPGGAQPWSMLLDSTVAMAVWAYAKKQGVVVVVQAQAPNVRPVLCPGHKGGAMLDDEFRAELTACGVPPKTQVLVVAFDGDEQVRQVKQVVRCVGDCQ